MFKVINKQILARGVKRLDVEAPEVASQVQPGQCVIVIPEAQGERIPLAVIDSDPRKGTITLIFQEFGEATLRLGAIPIGESVFSVIGPVGTPSRIGKEGVVVCVATGVGTAQILPICRAARAAGNKVIGVIGAKTRRALMLEPQMRLSCHQLYIATNDGSYERRGMATTIVKELLGKEKVDLVYAIGSVDMMQTVAEMTRERSVKNLIQTNTRMLCGIGICASCRVKVGGETLLACQCGPEFNGHKVDFEFLKTRVNAHKKGQDESLAGDGAREGEGSSLKRFLSDFLEKKV